MVTLAQIMTKFWFTYLWWTGILNPFLRLASLLPTTGVSTVRTRALQPALSAFCTNFSLNLLSLKSFNRRFLSILPGCGGCSWYAKPCSPSLGWWMRPVCCGLDKCGVGSGLLATKPDFRVQDIPNVKHAVYLDINLELTCTHIAGTITELLGQLLRFLQYCG